jgi:tetratricopeptide (TPR) repeat protein
MRLLLAICCSVAVLAPTLTLAAPAPRINPPPDVGFADSSLCLLERRATALEIIAACTRFINAAKPNDNAFMLSDAYNERGRAHAGLMQENEALADFTSAILLDPDSSDARFNRGTILLGQKKYDAALKDFDSAVENNPTDAMAVFDRGKTKWALGNRAAAEADFKAAIALDPRFEELRAQIK